MTTSLSFVAILSSYHAWQKRQVHRSGSTFTLYLGITQNFLRYLENQDKGYLNDVDAYMVREFVCFRKGHPPYSPASVKVREAALHLFFSWAYSQKLVRDNPVVGHKRSKIMSKEIPFKKKQEKIRELPFLTLSEQEKIQNYPVSDDFLEIRNHCLVLLFLASGLGIPAMLALENTAVHIKKGIIEKKDRGTKKRKVIVDAALFEKSYKNWLNMHPLKKQPSFPLCVTVRGKTLSRRALYNSISGHLEKIGIKKKSGAHLLRQTAIINALRKDKNLEKIQENFGIKTYGHAKTYGSTPFFPVDSDHIVP